MKDEPNSCFLEQAHRSLRGVSIFLCWRSWQILHSVWKEATAGAIEQTLGPPGLPAEPPAGGYWTFQPRV